MYGYVAKDRSMPVVLSIRPSNAYPFPFWGLDPDNGGEPVILITIGGTGLPSPDDGLIRKMITAMGCKRTCR